MAIRGFAQVLRENQLIVWMLDSVLPHPPYSPHLAPGACHLFPKLKKRTKGQRSSDDESVKTVVRNGFESKTPTGFKEWTCVAQVEMYWRVCQFCTKIIMRL